MQATVPTGRVGLLGLGNVLMGDDAVGPYAVRWLQSRHDFAAGVSALDLGTPGSDLLPHLAGLDAAIVVDAVRAEGDPGELRVYRREQILGRPSRGPRVSPHDPGLTEALQALDLADAGPRDVVLVGIIPGRVSGEIGLSSAVRASLPAVERVVTAELERLGVPSRRPASPRRPDLWWEAARP